MEGSLTELSLSAANCNVRLTYLEREILRQADKPHAGRTPPRESGIVGGRRGIVLCVSDEVADSLLRWMKQGCASLSALNPARLNVTSPTAHRGKNRHAVASSWGCWGGGNCLSYSGVARNFNWGLRLPFPPSFFPFVLPFSVSPFFTPPSLSVPSPFLLLSFP